MSAVKPLSVPSLSLVAPTGEAASTPARGVSFSTGGYTTARDGTRLHYYTVGEGAPAIVCCDGIGCDGYAWKYIAQEMAPRHRIVRWHYRAHGLSGRPTSPDSMTIAALVDDLVRVLDANRLEKAIFLGHSLGVQVILEMHRRHPGRVLALVPICGSYGRPLDTFKDSSALRQVLPVITRLIDRYPRAVGSFWKLLDSEFAYRVSLVTEVNPKLVRHEDFRSYFTHMAQMDPRLFCKLLADAAEHDAWPHLAKIDVPTLIIAGENDGFTPHWLSERMHARIPKSELCTIPTGTHTAPIELPELVTLRLRRFLDERVLNQPDRHLASAAS